MKTSEALEGFLLDCKARQLSEQSIIWYRQKIDRFVEWAKDPDLESCPRSVASAFLAQLGKEPETVLGYVKALKRLAKWAVDEELISSSPLTRLPNPKLPKKRPKTLDQEQLARLLSVCNDRDKALVLFLYDTGCRRSEVASLTLDNLDLRARTAIVMGKGKKQRLVVFGSTTAKALWRWLKRRPHSPFHHVFLNRMGRPMRPVSITRLFYFLGEKAGIGPIGPHTLRHSAATELIKAGMPTAVLQKLLGHHSVSVTERYVHLLAEDIMASYRSPVDQSRRG